MSDNWHDKDASIRSMELFTKELIPAMNKAVGSVADEGVRQ